MKWTKPAHTPFRLGSSLLLGVLLALASSGCFRGGATAPPKLRPVALQEENVSAIRFAQLPSEHGVSFTCRNGAEAGHCSILETLGGGVAALDYDGDGFQDLCFPGGGKYTAGPGLAGLPTGLFRNLDGRKFHNVSSVSKIESAPYYSHGVSIGDFDHDGFPDVFITGYGGVLLWKNQGDGTFTEVSRAAGVSDKLWSSSSAWGDINGDGALDLYVTRYLDWSFEKHPFCPAPKPGLREICTPHEFSGVPDRLFLSNGDGTFRDASVEAGLRTDESSKGLGLLLADVDTDGDLDIYVTNDATANHLYINDGAGKLHESGLARGVALDESGVANGSMGVDLCDYNADGRPDLWVANYEDEPFALYRNEGQGQFLHQSSTSGITAFGGMFVGFGTSCADLDLDGDEEILVANGHVLKYPQSLPVKQLPLALENRSGRYIRLSFPANEYFSKPHEGRGLALFDLDNDGDLDAAMSHINEPAAVLVNETATRNQWLRVRLIGVASNRDAVGARLVLHATSGDQSRQLKGGASYLSQGDSRVFWGVPRDAKIAGLTIHWPGGRVQRVDEVEANRQHTFIENP